MELDDQSFCWYLPLNVHNVYYAPPLLRGRLHLVRDTVLALQYCIDDTGARYIRDPRKQKSTKKLTFNKELEMLQSDQLS